MHANLDTEPLVRVSDESVSEAFHTKKRRVMPPPESVMVSAELPKISTFCPFVMLICALSVRSLVTSMMAPAETASISSLSDEANAVRKRVGAGIGTGVGMGDTDGSGVTLVGAKLKLGGAETVGSGDTDGAGDTVGDNLKGRC